MPLIATRGAASVQGFGEFAQAAAPVYIEDVFSTYLYTGNSSTQTITNNIDLSGKGGMVWFGGRNVGTNKSVYDTVRGATFDICTNLSQQQFARTTALTGFTTSGFTLGADTVTEAVNKSGTNYVSWTFREQPKFFDIVTYTGNGSNRTISHSLGSVPGCIMVKRTSATDSWRVYHRSLANNVYISLNNNDGQQTDATIWNSTTPTSTQFSVGTDTTVNANGATYVAYLFAHDAGGFGTTGSDNVISCGYFSGSVEVNLGYEAQWVLIKDPNGIGDWYLFDTMRGMSQTQGQGLSPNTSGAESAIGAFIIPTATGFKNVGGGAYIYIAIRRGPMKTPTSGTSVYTPIARSGNSTATTVTGVGFPPDLVFEAPRTNSGANNWIWFDRLRGGAVGLSSDNSGAEFTNSAVIQSDSLSTTMDGFRIQTANPINASGNTYIYYPLRRAPGFFDVVCYTGTGSNTTVTHNLGVAPELIICKSRSSNPGANWVVWNQTLNSSTGYLYLNATLEASNFAGVWNGAPTSTYFTLGTNYQNNNSGVTFVAYLFATVAGVSKVGSYTGTGALQTVNCGFTTGARFVLIKRSDSTGDWWVYDSARGISSGNDPYLLLNSNAAEVTNTNYVDTTSVGFQVTAAAPAGLNANGGTFIFLAVA